MIGIWLTLYFLVYFGIFCYIPMYECKKVRESGNVSKQSYQLSYSFILKDSLWYCCLLLKFYMKMQLSNWIVSYVQPWQKNAPAIKEIKFNLTLRTFLVSGILVLKIKLFLSWGFLKLIRSSWSLESWFLKPSWFLSWRFLKSSLTVS